MIRKGCVIHAEIEGLYIDGSRKEGFDLKKSMVYTLSKQRAYRFVIDVMSLVIGSLMVVSKESSLFH